MSDKENSAKDDASGAAKNADKSKSKRKKAEKYKFLSISNLHNLRTAQVFKYILKLHKDMRKLIRKLDKYKKKLKKSVGFLIHESIKMMRLFGNIAFFYRAEL